MKKYLMMVVALIFLACGDSTVLWNNTAIIDYDDSDVATLPDDPDFTGAEIGSTGEAWKSDRYHGQGYVNGNQSAGPCYGPSGNGESCLFPQFKQIDITFQGQGAACLQHRDYITSHGGTLNEYAQMVLSFEEGLAALNGIGTGVVLKENSSAGTNMTITASCYHTGTSLGEFDPQWDSSSQVSTLPASGGIDPLKSMYYNPATSPYRISFENIWDYVTRPVTTQPNGGCGFATVSNPVRLQTLKKWARHTGIHEALHMFGFPHFLSGMMAPGESCTDPGTAEDIPVGFGQALGDYVGGAGSVTINTGTINPTSVPTCPAAGCN